MDRIKIDVGSVIGLDPLVSSSAGILLNTQASLNGTIYQIDAKVLNRNNIRNRLHQVAKQIANTETKIQRIKSVVENGANHYYQAEMRNYHLGEPLRNQCASLGFIEPGLGIASFAETLMKDKIDIESFTETGTFDFKKSSKQEMNDDELKVEQSYGMEGSIMQGSIQSSGGIVHSDTNFNVGKVAAVGTIGAAYSKDGPSVYVNAKGEVTVASAESNITIGNAKNNIHGKAKGEVLTANAELDARVGAIQDEDGTTSYGVKGKAEAGAYAAKGEVSSVIEVCGIKFGVHASGNIGAGASAEGEISTGGVKGSIGATIGIGGDIGIDIDWSDFSVDDLIFW